MIRDTLGTFCDGTDLAGTTADTATLLGSQIDLGTGAGAFGGEAPYLVIVCDTDLVSDTGAGAIQFTVKSDDSASIHATTSTTHLITPSIATATTTAQPAGTVLFCGQLPSAPGALGTADGGPYEQFLGLSVIHASQDIASGTISAFLVKDASKWVAMPDAAN